MIHARAAPMPRAGSSVAESVCLVPNAARVLTELIKRAESMDLTQRAASGSGGAGGAWKKASELSRMARSIGEFIRANAFSESDRFRCEWRYGV